MAIPSYEPQSNNISSSYGSLGKLPLELRRKIYSLIVVRDFIRGKNMCNANDPRRQMARYTSIFTVSQWQQSQNMDVLEVSKAIRGEALDVMYNQSIMKLPICVAADQIVLSAVNDNLDFKCIMNLNISIDFVDHYLFYSEPAPCFQPILDNIYRTWFINFTGSKPRRSSCSITITSYTWGGMRNNISRFMGSPLGKAIKDFVGFQKLSVKFQLLDHVTGSIVMYASKDQFEQISNYFKGSVHANLGLSNTRVQAPLLEASESRDPLLNDLPVRFAAALSWTIEFLPYSFWQVTQGEMDYKSYARNFTNDSVSQ